MSLGIQWEVVLFFAIGLALLYAIGWLLLTPLKTIFRFILNGLIGGLLLLLFNFLGEPLGLFLKLNPVTALIAGFMGVPGIIMLLALSVILKL